MITIEINDAAVTAALDAATRVLTDMTPLMQEIGDALVVSTKRRFGQGVAPDGSKWAPKAPATLAKSTDSRPLFGPSGMLSSQISYEASADSVLIGSNRIYAAMMQFGGTKAKFPHLWGDIPARPFLGYSDADVEEVLEIISATLADALSGN
jgi:phage virion morphogenesis protein